MKKQDLFLAGFRVAVSLMMLTHGLPKLLKFEMMLGRFPNPLFLGSELTLVIAVFAELFCSLFLILGLFNRLSLLPLIITMIGAQVFHLGDPFAKKELSLLFLACYVLLLGLGLGTYRLKLSRKLEDLFQKPFKYIFL